MRKLFFILALLFVGTTTYSQKYQLHSVYIYSFIRYIQWPDAERTENFVIGVIGDSPVTPYLENMAASKTAGKKRIVIKKITILKEVSDCQMVFVSKDSATELEDVLTQVGDKSILVVTEEEGLGEKGSNVNFVRRDEKLTFEINSAAMKRAALKVSSELTRLAIII